MPPTEESSTTRSAAERAEFEAVLASPVFERAPKLRRFLSYVGEMYFAHRAAEIKEYTIAIHALGRDNDFDPQLDPIVRVSANALRKRLKQYYRGDGSDHELRIQLPLGQYVPQFVRNRDSAEPAESRSLAVGPPVPLRDAAERREPRSQRSWLWPLFAGMLLLLAALGLGWAWWNHHRSLNAADAGGVPVPGNSLEIGASTEPASASASGWYELLSDGPAYSDQAGHRWVPARSCEGGTIYHHPDQPVDGTLDPALFQSGRGSVFSCKFAVPPGTYELHLLFADTSNSEVASRREALAINDSVPYTWDIVNDAGGGNRAVIKVLPGIHPEADGFIHLKMENLVGYLSAVAILPGDVHGLMRPLRLVASPNGYTERNGQHWLPDQDFFGGTENRRRFPTAGVPDAGLYSWERFGRMEYDLPVAPNQLYTVRLYFSEGWFGAHKWAPGGVNSRVFSVSCNGHMLLPHLDILAATTPEHEALVKTIRHVAPTAMGTIVLDFYPEHDYPLVNAIEVLSEGAASPGRRQGRFYSGLRPTLPMVAPLIQ